MKTRTLLLFAIIFFLPVTSNAQVGNLVRNKLNKVINAGTNTATHEISKEADTAVDKEAQSARDKAAARIEENKTQAEQNSSEDKSESQDSQSQGGFNLGSLMGNKVDLKYNEDYGFSSRIYMLTESHDKKDVIKMDLFMYYSSSSPSIGVETKTISDENGEETAIPTSMVMDGENKCFIILTNINGTKMGIISAISDENTAPTDTKSSKKDNPPVFKKTGNTRMIAGYKCDEYSYTDPDDKTTGKVWFTKDANLKIDSRGWRNTSMASYYGNQDFNGGVILASESYDEKGNLSTKTETKEINPSYSHSISVKGYTLRQMNLNQTKGK
jgi:hypothetical protein